MGRKDKSKNKNKISGSEKTALKTEKKQNARQKKKLSALGEDDIEKVVAEIERAEARKLYVKEIVVEPPTRRINFTLNSHPFKDELIMLGGSYHDGRQTTVYGDMFFYNIKRDVWLVVKAPGAPPPRCSHQAVTTAARGGELWVFGGEFTSLSELQFYHYRDLWVYRLAQQKWEKITAPNGPSARSGHRMVLSKKHLIVFGGFHDNLRVYKCFNDVHAFDLETYTWHKIETTGNAPAPRSACILLPTPDNKILVYGGYCKTKAKKNIEIGFTFEDMFLLIPDKNDATKYKWMSVRQTGTLVTPRCGMSAVLIQPNQALLFGGVLDEESEEELKGSFYNDLFRLDLEKFQWHTVTLSEKKEAMERRKRRKQKEEEKNQQSNEEKDQQSDKENDQQSDEEEDQRRTKIKNEKDDKKKDTKEDAESLQQPLANLSEPNTVMIADGIFTMTLGPAPSKTISNVSDLSSNEKSRENVAFWPSPRINAGMAVKHNILYLYGGLVEDGDRQYTLSDFYSLDYRKLQEWKTLLADNLALQMWYSSSDEDEDESENDSSDDDSSDDKNDNEQVDTNLNKRDEEDNK